MWITGVVVVFLSGLGMLWALAGSLGGSGTSPLLWPTSIGMLIGGLLVVSLQQIRGVLVELRDAGVDALELESADE